MKKYLDENVYDACIKRLNYIFDEFENVYISVSGGKDSSVMVQIANKIALERGREFDVFYVDYEAQYTATIDHIYELKKLSQIGYFYHICLPFNSHNASSIFQPHWITWNPQKKDKWVREMPKDCINIDNHPFGELFEYGEEVETFMVKFPKWLNKKKGTDKAACLVGIRTDESMNRFRAIAFGKSLYKDKVYSTKISKGVYNFYPIYDWRTEDIWHCVSKLDLMFNDVYNQMFFNGVGIHDQRICQPYGSDQRVSLNQWARYEPQTWHKIVNRVSGANFGSLYCKTKLLGHNGTQKPDHLTWQEYTIFLLETTGAYSKTLMNHYVRKFKIYFKYYKDNYNVDIKDIPDYRTPIESKENGKGAHWKRIAKVLEKNDYACKGLNYGLTIPDKDEMISLKKEWGDNLGIQEGTKDMRMLKEEIDKL